MKRYRLQTEGEIPFPLAPMIDLIFLLLIFFMVTSRISKETVREKIHLPVASSGWIPKDASHRDVIDVGRGGEIVIARKAMGRAELEAHLRSRLQGNTSRKIYLRADAVTPARKIKEIMNVATAAGATQVIIGTIQQ